MHSRCFCISEKLQLVALLKEMKDGLDLLRSKVRALTMKVMAKCWLMLFDAKLKLLFRISYTDANAALITLVNL